jgi:streptogramin lyase
METLPGPTAAELRLQRNLKIIVIVLGLLMFAGLAAIAGRVIYLASGSATQPAGPVPAMRPAELKLGLPAGAQVRAVSLSGDRLAVHYEAAGAEGIAVLDLATGATVTTVGIERAPAGN